MDTALKSVSRYKFGKIFTFIVLICIMAITLPACDPCWGNYPDEVHSQWVCRDPEFVLDYTVIDTGKTWDAYCVIDGEVCPLIVAYASGRFDIFPWEASIETLHYEDLLVSGTWKYRHGKLVFTIEEDHLFGGGYRTLEFEGSGVPVQ